MISLLTSSEKRQLQLLDFLNRSITWWKIDTLASELQVSDNKIRKDIEKLLAFSQTEDNVFEILLDPLKGVYLKTDAQTSIQLIQSKYVKQTVSYQLIDALVQSNEISLNDLLTKLYLSRSTLYRHVRRLNKVLAKNKLEISVPSADLVGEEAAIREFLYYFYWSVADDGDWPFKTITSDTVYLSVKDYTDFGNIKYSKVEVIQVMFRLAINFMRHSQKKFIQSMAGVEYVDPYRKAYIASVSDLMPAIIPPDYRQNEENFLRLLIVSYPFLDERHLDYQKINRWYQKQNGQAYQLMFAIRQQLVAVSTDKPLVDNPILEFRLLAICIYSMVFPQLHLQLSATRNKNQQFVNRLPEVYNKVSKVITPEKGGRNDLLLAEVYRVLEKSELIQLFQPLLYVKLRCVKSPLTEPDLKRELLNRAKQKLSVDITKDNQQSTFSYDVFISDMRIPYTEQVKSKRFYLWQTQPTERDWEEIAKILSECAAADSLEE
ncbi:helix-turn-helix domain-containing protein [Vagococcus sp. BWB3-3]|uniref:Helix-turn-helix domain-containing protein n=1 Tax=Vagococcus allomyrinae TaxID=2794353 RepID=A0A940P5U7_9ENTE|nr:helix-turn-helix domain-containing protein [Vagococcus allomyrinae]MBP1040306.1 helix-turn-helix domain-containing protein [Vagococcus allomyrinae]